MTQRRIGGWNIAGYVLYLGLCLLGLYEFLFAGLAFAMSTDSCHDAACDAEYHVDAAMNILMFGIAAVLLLIGAVMVSGSIRGRGVFGWPFLGLLGLGAVLGAAVAVVH